MADGHARRLAAARGGAIRNMRLNFLFVLVILVSSCLTLEGEKEKTFVSDQVGKEDVVLILSDYALDSIPKEVGLLQNAKSLKIVLDSANLYGLTIYPPLSAGGPTYGPNDPSMKFLPKEITYLKKLQKLSLVGIGIEKLPDGFSNLQSLEFLDLSMNKLDISTELNKLKGLPKLKVIELLGNNIDTLEIKNWERERPGLQINYKFDFEKRATTPAK